MIDKFAGVYDFLSNFYCMPIVYKGKEYMNAEAAFQAQKTLSEDEKSAFKYLVPAEAKRLGRQLSLRPDWEEVKDQIMYEIVREKFTFYLILESLLLSTGDKELIEGNTWGDTYWGVCNGKGQNKLGKILMRIRKELKDEREGLKNF